MSNFIPTLKLYQVPAGRRLDFNRQAGHFAYVYRRNNYSEWQCIARHACSPYFDASFLPVGSLVEYVVCYYDANGKILAATPIVQAPPVDIPLLAGRVSASQPEHATV